MEEAQSLLRLSPGERGQVKGLAAGGPLRRRLQDLGFVPGAQVECVAVSPLGAPAAYWVRGAVVALRREDARRVLLKGG